MIHQGNLVIRTAEDVKAFSGVEKVTGDLYIHSTAKLDAPLLESVGGYLYIHSTAKLDALKSVGGYLSINSTAKLDALKSVGGYLSINSTAKLDAPLLESVGGNLYIHSTAKLDAPLLYAGGFSNFKVHDGIPCVLLSSKKLGKTTLLSCRKSKIKNGKIVGDKFFVAQQGRVNAHGNTAREAVAELHFKTSKRDISQYKAMPLSTSNTPFEWGLIYRAITGACQFGVKDFMQRHGKLKKRYTLKEILEITKGAYRSEAFASVVKEPD